VLVELVPAGTEDAGADGVGDGVADECLTGVPLRAPAFGVVRVGEFGLVDACAEVRNVGRGAACAVERESPTGFEREPVSDLSGDSVADGVCGADVGAGVLGVAVGLGETSEHSGKVSWCSRPTMRYASDLLPAVIPLSTCERHAEFRSDILRSVLRYTSENLIGPNDAWTPW